MLSPSQHQRGLREFHISRIARDRYQFDLSLFSLSGNVIFVNLHAARVFAQQMNQQRDLVTFPEQAVKPGQLNAMGLIDEILHYVVALYREQCNPHVLRQALEWLYDKHGRSAVDTALRHFADQFPPLAVYRRQVALGAYLVGETAGEPNRQIALEELLLLWLANANPAFAPFLELFDDARLEKLTVYPQLIASLHDFFETQPRFGPDNQNLIDMLRSPAIAVPHSLEGQLAYILERWGTILGKYLSHLLSSLDVIKEERKLIFPGPGPAQVYEYAGLEHEPEHYSRDRDWMPRLVLMAKNIYVWLDQLSKKYQRPLTCLDQIPDEELDALARWGFTGLWLIGIWERSPASQMIKQLCGNPEAVPSAYSLYDYQIAADLGGEAACANLRERAWRRGIRLSSDMVPNHVGIYSRWVIEHPDWFIALDHNPYPWYEFAGPELSLDERVGILIENHYYNRTDAAVVFQRRDRWTGSEQYIYHGNDGTSMPWNDTAQLNYLVPETREAVIQTILHVARQFPVIRFDAAMTLTKRHYQRLWFPEPGSGGAIPTRAEHGMTKAQFDAAMPEEFWREVVDRIAAEAPGTLLLAEAFWLLEGYFVRTLGMHRVYNSAFMNMLRDEDNAKYRQVMKNTQEFDPEVLRRFVNFMNNPDERTAVDQFGKDDKYFGICMLLVTMPGLPMFGHGQIEGLSEKYGMEYQRAYWDEQPDSALIARHEREIFPLLRRRYLFAGVEHFLLYDFFTPEGQVNEDVFAYSNRSGDECALIVYHNRYAEARGWIRTSAAYAAKAGDGDERALVRSTLSEGLELHADRDHFCIFHDYATGLEYIRNSQDLFNQGLYVELGAYQYHIFLDIREVRDNARQQYAELAASLNGRGVPSIDVALHELFLQPVLVPFRALVNSGMFRRLLDARVTEPGQNVDVEVVSEVEQQLTQLLGAIKEYTSGAGDVTAIARKLRHELETMLMLPVLAQRLPAAEARIASPALAHLQSHLTDDPVQWSMLLGWLAVHALGRIVTDADAAEYSRSWLDEWLLGRIIADTLQAVWRDDTAATDAVTLLKLLTSHQGWWRMPGAARADRTMEALLADGDVQRYLRVNRYRGALWVHKESFERLLWWLLVVAVVQVSTDPQQTAAERAAAIAACYAVVQTLQRAAERSRYQLERLLEGI